ncbi:MAG: hypothetical protein HY812_16315 [Planctomycetes bacterium]|nr:hypothetical protein [Planctomycetota bacterium]
MRSLANPASPSRSSAPLRCLGRSAAGVLRLPAALLLAAGLVAAATAPLHAANPERLSAQDLVQQAELIVEAVVTDVAYRNSDVADEADVSLPHTFVTLSIERAYKGASAAGSQLTLRMEGGPDGAGRVLVVSDVPLFRPGDRDILFIRDNGSSVCPLVGWQQGRFRVVRGQVYNDLGQEVWITPEGRFAFGERRVDPSVFPYPEVREQDSAGEPRTRLVPPQGSILPDAAGFGAVVREISLDLSARGLLAQGPPVESASPGAPFFRKKLLQGPPPADLAVKAPKPFAGAFDAREAELIEKERAEHEAAGK